MDPQPSPGLPLASQDRTCEIVEDTESSRMVKKMKKRICLVLDCLCAHDFSDKTADLINLQHYVIKEKRLSERETVVIFYDVVRVVEALHQVRLCPSVALSSAPGASWAPSDKRPQGPKSCGKPPFLLLLSRCSCPSLTQVCFAAGNVQGSDQVPLLLGHWAAGIPGEAWPGQPSRAPCSSKPSVKRLHCSVQLRADCEIRMGGSHSLSLSFF